MREQMSDLISKQAAIETIRKCAVKEVTPAYMLIDKAEAMTELMKLPSAEPEPCDFCANKDDCDDMRIYCPARPVERQTERSEL